MIGLVDIPGQPLWSYEGWRGGGRGAAVDVGEDDAPVEQAGAQAIATAHDHQRLSAKEKLDANWRKEGP